MDNNSDKCGKSEKYNDQWIFALMQMGPKAVQAEFCHLERRCEDTEGQLSRRLDKIENMIFKFLIRQDQLAQELKKPTTQEPQS